LFVPSSVVVLGKESFHECESLESVTFESGSRLERMEKSAFCGSGVSGMIAREAGEEEAVLELAGWFDDLFG
jgi:hypothetical protein